MSGFFSGFGFFRDGPFSQAACSKAAGVVFSPRAGSGRARGTETPPGSIAAKCSLS